jgi:ABC-type amino acid transport substrate-binding protein
MPRLSLHGELLVDGKWSGIMGMLTEGEVDVSCSDLTMTTSRLNVVDFIEPVWADRCVYRCVILNIIRIQVKVKVKHSCYRPELA